MNLVSGTAREFATKLRAAGHTLDATSVFVNLAFQMKTDKTTILRWTSKEAAAKQKQYDKDYKKRVQNKRRNQRKNRPTEDK